MAFTGVTDQCDQIGQFFGLWATFQSLRQQLICPNFPHSKAIFVKFIWATFKDIWRLFTGHTAHVPPTLIIFSRSYSKSCRVVACFSSWPFASRTWSSWLWTSFMLDSKSLECFSLLRVRLRIFSDKVAISCQANRSGQLVLLSYYLTTVEVAKLTVILLRKASISASFGRKPKS